MRIFAITMAYSGIQFSSVNLTPQETERLKKRAAQELKINTFVALPSLGAIAVLVVFCNTQYKGQTTLLEIINGIAGLGGGILAWWYVRFLLGYKKDVKSGKKKVTTGMVEGKRILNPGKFNESHRMLFQKTEFELTPEIYKLINPGMRIELSVTEKNERVLGIKKLV
jgi:hypothetical protein